MRLDELTSYVNRYQRQGLAYILVRQVTGLLQRTKLNVTISCQAWHAKNSRHMLLGKLPCPADMPRPHFRSTDALINSVLDIVDHVEPTMLIVGSRGLGQLNGCVYATTRIHLLIGHRLYQYSILLGSTSHYLIQKCSVPVMVARRRLKRPPKRNAHLATHRTHVSLAEAGIDRVAAKVDQDVQVMRDEIQKDDNRRDGGPGSRDGGRFTGVENEGEPDDDEGEDENDDEPAGIKVCGSP